MHLNKLLLCAFALTQVIAFPVFDIENIEVAAVGDAGQPCLNGKVGICGTPSSCKTSTVTGACNGGASNVCCLKVPGDAGMPCLSGKAGICGTPSSCKTSTVTGACNGGASNVCCLTAPPVKPPAPAPVQTPGKGPGDAGMACLSGQAGTCGTASSCKTQPVSGYCKGGSDNVCCLTTMPVTPPPGSNPWTVAFNNKNIVFNDFHQSGVKDEATAYREARDAAAGKPVQLSAYQNAPGGTTRLIPQMANVLNELAKVGKVGVNEIAGGSHSAGSRHYAGIGIDIGSFNGKRLEKGVAEAMTVINMCKKLGAENIFNANLNCGSTCDQHNGWVHCDWPRSAAVK